jgi:hypothetical protein
LPLLVPSAAGIKSNALNVSADCRQIDWLLAHGLRLPLGCLWASPFSSFISINPQTN